MRTTDTRNDRDGERYQKRPWERPGARRGFIPGLGPFGRESAARALLLALERRLESENDASARQAVKLELESNERYQEVTTIRPITCNVSTESPRGQTLDRVCLLPSRHKAPPVGAPPAPASLSTVPLSSWCWLEVLVTRKGNFVSFCVCWFSLRLIFRGTLFCRR